MANLMWHWHRNNGRNERVYLEEKYNYARQRYMPYCAWCGKWA